MLLQSHDGAIHLLPALPDAWKEGSIKGLRARGGFEVEIKWSDNKPEEVTLISTLGGNCRIRSYHPLSGKNLKEAKGNNPNSYYQVFEIKEALVSPEADLKAPELKTVFEYDLATSKGGKYILRLAN
jgi:alpha-L-fucosidase 2